MPREDFISEPGFMDYVVPAIPRTSYVGNGANDALRYLTERDFRDTMGPGQEDRLFDIANERRGTDPADVGEWSRDAFAHDVGTRNPDGTPRGTLGQVGNDLQFAADSLGNVFSGPTGPFEAIGGAAFGLGAAAYHGLSGLGGAAWSGISSVGSAIGGAIGGIGRAVGGFFSKLFPVVLDLDGDGLDLVSLTESGARVDADGDGALEATGWIAPEDGLLLFDADRSGGFSALREIAFVEWDETAKTDLEGLAHFDADADGHLTEADAAAGGFGWDQFLLWQDADGDGAHDAGETVTLSAAGIAEVALALNGEGWVEDGNEVHNTTTFTRTDGTTGLAGDVSFLVAEEGVALDWG